MTQTRFAPAALTAAVALAALTGSARADNPLSIFGAITPTDPIAIGFDGPNAPGPSTFYYDLYTFTVDTAGTYAFAMNSLSPGLAPWIGVYANNFTPIDYLNPLPIDLVASPLGSASISMNLLLSPGTYQALVSSIDWIENPAALDEGPYSVSITGPDGANITLIPAPGAGLVLGTAGAFLVGRRRRTR